MCNTLLHRGEVTMTASIHPYSKNCVFCQQVFTARKSTTKFCSLKCAQRAYKESARQKKLVDTNREERSKVMADIKDIQAREVLSMEEACTLLGVSRWTVNRYLKKSKIKTIKFMGRRLILRTEIDKILNIK
jgi:excisionase family DNA binding protein